MTFARAGRFLGVPLAGFERRPIGVLLQVIAGVPPAARFSDPPCPSIKEYRPRLDLQVGQPDLAQVDLGQEVAARLVRGEEYPREPYIFPNTGTQNAIDLQP